MNAERWEQLKELFEAALEREDPLRAAFLDEACAGDPSLREELGELIESHERAGGFLGASAFEAATTVVSEDRLEVLVGSRIGPYEIIREIGRGGMGAVYLALAQTRHTASKSRSKSSSVAWIQTPSSTAFGRNDRSSPASITPI